MAARRMCNRGFKVLERKVNLGILVNTNTLMNRGKINIL